MSRVLSAFIFCLAIGTSALSFAAAESFGDVAIDKLIVMPASNGHIDWINAINSARTSVHMTMYHLTDRTVIDALINKAKDPAVDVRVIVDGKSLTGGYALAIKTLTDVGVKVKGSSPAFSLTHSKEMVIDKKSAFIGAVDLTNTSTKMRDFAIVTSDASVISEVENVFEVDWTNAQSGAMDTPAVSQPNLVWSPTNSDNRLVNLIDSANSSLVLESENFNNTDIINALNRASARGVQVRMVLPECAYGNPALNYQGIAPLKGATVRMAHDGGDIQQPYIHSKMMIIDSKTIYVGSINFSFNSILNDRELGIIFTDLPTATAMGSEFETDWNRSLPPSATPNCPQN